MVCNFRAVYATAMPQPPRLSLPADLAAVPARPARLRPTPARATLGPLAAALALMAATAPCAHAERDDRNKPMTVDSNGAQPDVVDLAQQKAVFTGNVVITQGTLQIHADRVEVSQDKEGNRLGFAYGSAEHPATFRQRRDRPDEWSEGEAQRIEYDSAANRVRFIGNAHLRMLHGATITDQASAALITYDTAADTVALNGAGDGSATPANPGGRTTVVFTPRQQASGPAPKPLELPPPSAAAPASASGAAP
jgi:lipopolysaccharide export system protein LptA